MLTYIWSIAHCLILWNSFKYDALLIVFIFIYWLNFFLNRVLTRVDPKEKDMAILASPEWIKLNDEYKSLTFRQKLIADYMTLKARNTPRYD